MKREEFYKVSILEGKKRGIIKSQKELGERMGYTNESSFSQVLTGKRPEPAGFVAKMKSILTNLDVNQLSCCEPTDGVKIDPLEDLALGADSLQKCKDSQREKIVVENMEKELFLMRENEMLKEQLKDLKDRVAFLEKLIIREKGL